MSTRNKLLERIVLALGGTVTNPNNRNQLLYDWLTALGGVPPLTRLAPNFNGVSQYAEFSSPTVYTGDFEISVNAMLPESIPASNVAFFGGSGGSGSGGFTLFINSSGQVISTQIPTSSGNRYDLSTDINQYLGLTIELKVARVSGVWSLLINGATVDTYDSNPHGVIDQEVANIGRWSTTLYYQGVVYDYADSLGSNFPMDDGWDSNPTMRNIGTGADGTFVNMTEAAWVEIEA